MDEGCGCRKKDLRKITYPDGFSVNYDKDSAGRVTSVYQDANTVFARYTYNSPLGGLSDIQWGDGYNQHYAFDDKGTLQQNRITGEDGSFISWDYEYNGNKQVNRIGERVYRMNPASDDQAKFTYAYDQLGRLTSATHSIYDGVNYVSDQVNSFTYDQFGNMLSNRLVSPLNGISQQSTFDVNPSNNRLNSYEDSLATISVSYDAAGNMLSEGARSYAYDGAGRMTNAGPDAGLYRYDAFGRRIQKNYVAQSESNVSQGQVISVYGPNNELFADYSVQSDESGVKKSIADYVVNGGQAIALRVTPEGDDLSIKYLRRNHLQQVIDPASYSINAGMKSMQGKPYSSGGDNQFQGHKDDAESGLHYNLARSYNPTIFRWMTPDPILAHPYDPQSLNKHSYNRNDPMNKVDANGNDPIADFIMAHYAWLIAISSPSNSEGGPVNPFDVPLLADLMAFMGMDPSLAYLLAYGNIGAGGYGGNQIGSGGGGGLIPPLSPEERLHNIITGAKNALSNTDCANLFNTEGSGLNPQDLLEKLYEGDPLYGNIQLGSIPPVINNGSTYYINASTDPIRQNSSDGTVVYTMAITMNTDPGRTFSSENLSEAVVTMLHELGHVYASGYGGSLIKYDKDDALQSKINTEMVKGACDL
jgi:RHS repeat-associated protein